VALTSQKVAQLTRGDATRRRTQRESAIDHGSIVDDTERRRAAPAAERAGDVDARRKRRVADLALDDDVAKTACPAPAQFFLILMRRKNLPATTLCANFPCSCTTGK
jgi:hypothetical protein